MMFLAAICSMHKQYALYCPCGKLLSYTCTLVVVKIVHYFAVLGFIGSLELILLNS